MRFFIAVLAVVGVGACVEPTPNPGTLPPYLLEKSIFTADGEWRLNRTVVQVPFQAMFTWQGDGDYPDRVRFRIEEQYLIAYRSRPVYVATGPDAAGLNDYEAPVAIWPIRRHFDVVGGQIVDAPRKAWYDKTWFEVEWARELTGTYRFSLTNMESAPREEPAYAIMDPRDPDAPIFSRDYVDFTTHLTFKASLGEDPEEQTPGLCGGAVASSIVDAIDCTPLNVAYRTSIMKIPADHQFEMKRVDRESVIDVDWASRFFRNGRLVYDDEYGLVDNSAALQISRLNLYERSFDEAGEPLPLRDRPTRTIPFYLSENFPRDVAPLVEEALAQWDEVFVSTVHDGRAFECVEEGGGDLESCRDDVERPERILALCVNNPVKRGDPAHCGAEGTRVRLGDQRYFMIHWNDTPQIINVLGIGWWVPDMQTGEIYSAHMHVWPTDVNKAASYIRDAVLLAQGRLAPDDLMTGAHTFDLTRDLQTYAANPYAAIVDTGAPAPPPARSVAELMSPLDPTVLPESDIDRPLGGMPVLRDAALAPIIGAPEEVLGIDWETAVLAGFNPEVDALDESMIAAASPFRTPYVERKSTLKEALAARLAHVGADVDFPTDIEIAPSVEEMADMTPDEIYAAARSHYLRWIFLHEFGHMFGMRHQFEGSYDALNFPQEYWDLRDDGDMRPRYLDPMSAEERDGKIDALATSSIMDYFSTPLGTPTRLGKYDESAIRWAYGDQVEVFDRQLSEEAEEAVKHLWFWPSLAPAPTYVIEDPTGLFGHRHTGLHYTDLPTRIGDLNTRAWIRQSSLRDELGWGFPSVDEQGRVAVPHRSCTEELADFAPSCLRYDRGADAYEILSSTVNWFQSYYVLNSFRRGRTTFHHNDYVAYVRQRLVTPIFDIHSNWLHLQWEYEPEAFTDDHFLAPITRGVDLAYEFLARLIVMPEPGDYYQRDMPDGPVLLASRDYDAHVNPEANAIFHGAFEEPPDPATKVMTLPLGVGRIYRSIDVDDGRNRLVLDNIGSAVDKELALEALIQPQYFLFTGRGTWEDPRVWMVSYAKSHRKQMLDLIGSIAAGDMSRLAPVWDGSQVRYRTFMDIQSTVADQGTAISPAVGFNLRIRALIFGLALLAENQSDRSFLDMARIVTPGGADDAPTTDPTIEFTDQTWTGESYKARSRVIDGVEMGIGYRMLQRAQALQTALQATTDQREIYWHEKALREQLDLIVIVRALVKRFDEHEYDFWEILDPEELSTP